MFEILVIEEESGSWSGRREGSLRARLGSQIPGTAIIIHFTRYSLPILLSSPSVDITSQSLYFLQ